MKKQIPFFIAALILGGFISAGCASKKDNSTYDDTSAKLAALQAKNAAAPAPVTSSTAPAYSSTQTTSSRSNYIK